MKTILVVEDEVAIAELVKATLEDEGYAVTTAENGREGLARLAEVRPDLVLCDIMMPIVDGRQMCRTMQADHTYRSIPVVLVSAVGDSIVRGECDYAAFLRKPFDLDHLLDTVARLIDTADPSVG